ncbi:MAG TPA: tRNA (adenosine(37)-N6)-threonylcarbamoyltransferase complex dimerization subunit type 1 TsaB [Verrucomicrobiota bacterium]|nr:tRNA (adenosine(37)-N6)-threonylcarbamoyltransferase complex dimerization subunit type 1 TsaB [Verrucomicrobiota bacterium]
MKILALDFSSAQRSVAVAEGGRVLSEIIETGGRGTNAIDMMDSALREAKLEREQVECLAIGLGPGSYTGIRAAISVAQGWQLARNIKLLGLSSAECLATQAWRDGLTGRVNVVIDAQRGEIYIAGYEISPAGFNETQPLRLTSPGDVAATEMTGAQFIGPEVTRWFASGRIVFPRAATLAEQAVRRTDFVAGEQLEPIYLRETAFVKAPPPRLVV